MKYIFIICPLISLVICQAIKFIVEFLNQKNISLKIITSSGGMPSAHSCFISSITTLIGLKEGFDSSIFALSLVFSMIIFYDAMNVRYESGMHAKLLNEKFNLKMKENLGHKLLEVIVGIILGILIASIFYFNIK